MSLSNPRVLRVRDPVTGAELELKVVNGVATFYLNGERIIAFSQFIFNLYGTDVTTAVKALSVDGNLSVSGNVEITGVIGTDEGTITYGANDSGGAGFRLLRVPNS